MGRSIEGQSSDVPEVLIKERKNNFFVYASDGNLLFEAYCDKTMIDVSKFTSDPFTGDWKKEQERNYYAAGYEYEIYL